MRPAFLRFQPKASKYRNKKCEVDGIVFDSKKEAGVYSELKTLLAAGEIAKLDRQVTYELIPAQYEEQQKADKKGRLVMKRVLVERPITYTADFVVTFPDGEVSVIDVKGMPNDRWPLKRKMMLYFHKIKIKEV